MSMRDNVSSLTNYALATSEVRFKLSSEHEKLDENVLSMTKKK